MKTYAKIATTALAVCGILTGRAEEPAPKNHYDFSFIERSSPWLQSSNGAGLRWLTVPNTSIAEVYFTKSDGDFRNYHESSDSYQFGLKTESYYTLKKVTLYGKIGYNNFMGKNMTGSVWTDPYHAPFNLVEYDPADAGKKNREDYYIAAGAGYDLARNLRIGARFDYTASNYTKRKDLRTTNTQLDMDLTLGATYSICGKFTIGANYIYSRDIQTIKFETFGVADKNYFVQITPGAFYGLIEQYGTDGYTNSKRTMPLFNQYHGIAVQLAANTSKFDLYYEFTYKNRTGYYGLKHYENDPVLTDHRSDGFSNKFYLGVKGRHSIHSLRLSSTYEKLENHEQVYERGKDEGGSPYINYFGSNRNANRETIRVEGEYESSWGIRDYMPTWTVTLDGRYWQQDLTASVFPFYRDQVIKNYYAGASLCKNFFAGRNVIGAKIRGGYGKGSGFEYRDGTYVTPSASTAVPKDIELYRQQEFEYLTTGRFTGTVSARYTRLFKKGINAYADVSYNFTSADKAIYTGTCFNVFNITLGCSF